MLKPTEHALFIARWWLTRINLRCKKANITCKPLKAFMLVTSRGSHCDFADRVVEKSGRLGPDPRGYIEPQFRSVHSQRWRNKMSTWWRWRNKSIQHLGKFSCWQVLNLAWIFVYSKEIPKKQPHSWIQRNALQATVCGVRMKAQSPKTFALLQGCRNLDLLPEAVFSIVLCLQHMWPASSQKLQAPVLVWSDTAIKFWENLFCQVSVWMEGLKRGKGNGKTVVKNRFMTSCKYTTTFTFTTTCWQVLRNQNPSLDTLLLDPVCAPGNELDFLLGWFRK